ncbi:hypothetical protein MKX01_035346 [Papaver californicum]|nr:hypothetical protein MKX01_035346 [Papaver californicum]
MVIRGAANQENWGNQESFTKGGCSSVSGGGGSAASAGGCGKSMSTCGSVGSSPSSKTLNRLNHLDIQAAADDAGSPGKMKKKKIAQTRAVGGGGGGGGGRGLRQFSIKVCEKVESKGRTTYNEVADELVAEFSTTPTAPGEKQNYDEKNIRRRVYDALNVLMAMDIISKDENKEIQWRGLPRAADTNAVEELKAERIGLINRNANKAAYLQELEDQFVGLRNLIQRNEQLCCSGNAAATSGGVPLPFILVQTRPHATVEVEISEDMQLVHFDFNTTPFELHDDSFVLKSMGFCDGSSPMKNTDVCTQESEAPQVNRQLLPSTQDCYNQT